MAQIINRQMLVKQLDLLLSNCNGCTRPPQDMKGVHGAKEAWCRENCSICNAVAQIGPQLNYVAAIEKRKRKTRNQSLPKNRTFAGIKKELLDVVASEQFDVAL